MMKGLWDWNPSRDSVSEDLDLRGYTKRGDLRVFWNEEKLLDSNIWHEVERQLENSPEWLSEEILLRYPIIEASLLGLSEKVPELTFHYDGFSYHKGERTAVAFLDALHKLLEEVDDLSYLGLSYLALLERIRNIWVLCRTWDPELHSSCRGKHWIVSFCKKGGKELDKVGGVLIYHLLSEIPPTDSHLLSCVSLLAGEFPGLTFHFRNIVSGERYHISGGDASEITREDPIGSYVDSKYSVLGMPRYIVEQELCTFWYLFEAQAKMDSPNLFNFQGSLQREGSELRESASLSISLFEKETKTPLPAYVTAIVEGRFRNLWVGGSVFDLQDPLYESLSLCPSLVQLSKDFPQISFLLSIPRGPSCFLTNGKFVVL